MMAKLNTKRTGEIAPTKCGPINDEKMPFGDFLVSLTRPGYDDLYDEINEVRKAGGRSLPNFD
jgi:hypothetical protein